MSVVFLDHKNKQATVYLHGRLGEKFGPRHELNAANAAEAIRLLAVSADGFTEELDKCSLHVIRGDLCNGCKLDANEDLLINIAGSELHLVPADDIVGAGGENRGAAKVVVGAILIAAAFYTGGASLGADGIVFSGFAGQAATFLGASLILGGISMMLAPAPRTTDPNKVDEKASFTFQGAVNVSGQGHPVPLVYGRIRTGSVVISTGISVERVTHAADEFDFEQIGPNYHWNPRQPYETGSGGVSRPHNRRARRHVPGRLKHQIDPIPDASTEGVVGAGGGGSKQETPSFSEAPNTLQSKAILRVLDLISEGPIEGLVDGAESIYLDETPIENPDTSTNFDGIGWYFVPGELDQPYIPGFPGVETEVIVNTEVTFATPIIRRINEPETDAVRITESIPALTRLDEERQRLVGSSVHTAIDVKPDADNVASNFIEVTPNWTIAGKTTSNFEQARRVDLPGIAPWDVRIRRLTADSVDANLNNETHWARYTRIIDHKFSYPHSAIVGLEIDSEYFGQSVPGRAYDVKGLIIDIPSNYNPITRAYTGLWDGNFVQAWTDNPAWIFRDLLVNRRYGLGVDTVHVDKAALFAIAQYCDQLVPDGFGGTEPRFTFNGVINTREDAFRVLQSLASVFRGMMFWGAGLFTAVQDRPEDIDAEFNNSNGTREGFEYSSSSKEARHTRAIVEWINPAIGDKPDFLVVEDPDGINRYGVNDLDTVAWGCKSRGQAHRFGKWQLVTEKFERDTCTFKSGYRAGKLFPGQLIRVADKYYAGVRLGGRVVSATTNSVTLDAPFEFEVGETYDIAIVLKDGAIFEAGVTNAPGTTAVVTIDTPLPPDPTVPGAVWTIIASNVEPRVFRVLSVTEQDKHLWQVTAIEHFSGKFSLVDENPGFEADTPTVSVLPNLNVTSPPSNLAASYETRLIVDQLVPSIRVSWTPSPDANLQGYRVSYRVGDDNWTILPIVQTHEEVIDNLEVGVYEISVAAVNFAGIPSRPIFTTIDLAPFGDAIGKNLVFGLQIAGGGTSFAGQDALLEWQSTSISQPDATGAIHALDQFFAGFRVRVKNLSDVVLRTEETFFPRFTYTLQKNQADGADRSFKIGVSVKAKDGSFSNEVVQTFTNPAPALPSHTASVDYASLTLNIARPNDPDYAGILVWRSFTPGFTPGPGNLVFKGAESPVIPSVPGATYYYRYAAFDAFGETGLNVSAEFNITTTLIDTGDIALEAITVAQFAQGITPVEILPSLPVVGNFVGRQVFLTTDNKTYRYNGTTFVATVATVDITGQIASAQIATGAVIAGHLGNAAVEAAAIAANAVITDKIAPSAVVADRIANAAVEAAKIASAAVTTDKIAANAVVASKIYVTDTTNYVLDHLFDELAVAWFIQGTPGNVTVNTGANITALAAPQGIQIAGAGMGAGSFHVVLPSAGHRAAVEAGKTYRARFRTRYVAGYTGRSDVRISWYDHAGTFLGNTQGQIGNDNRTVAAVGTVDQDLQMQAVAPANAHYGSLGISVNWSSTLTNGGFIYFAHPRMERAVSGELIVDGTITAAHIAAGTITAAQIASGTITANEIAAQAIVASKIFVTDTTNYVLDHLFNDFAVYWNTAPSPGGSVTVDTSANVTALFAPQGIRMAGAGVGAGVTTHCYTRVNHMPAVEAGRSYRARVRTRYLTGFTGRTKVSLDWFTQDKVFISESAANGTDFRTVAAGSNANEDLEVIGTAPANAHFVQFHLWTVWSSTLTNAGFAYFAHPRMERAVSAELIVDGTITAAKIAADTITAAQIAAGTITAAEIAAATITGDRIAANTITGSNIAADTITAGQIQAGAIGASEIAAQAIIASKIAITDTTNYVADHLFNDVPAYWFLSAGVTVDTSSEVTTQAAPRGLRYAGSGVPAGEERLANVQDNFRAAVEAGKTYRCRVRTRYVSGYTGRAALRVSWWAQDGAFITSSPFVFGDDHRTSAAGSTVQNDLEGLIAAPANAHYARFVLGVQWSSTLTNAGFLYAAHPRLERAVSGELIVDGTITASKIVAGTITANEIAGNTITGAKIAAATITASNIAADTITAAQIATGTITASEIAASTITGDRIAAATITGSNIQAGTITATQIAAGTITADRIATGTITADRLVLNGISTDRIANNAIEQIAASYTAGSLEYSASETTVQTTVITTTGRPVLIGFAVNLQGSHSGSDLNARTVIRVRRDGSLIYSGQTGMYTHTTGSSYGAFDLASGTLIDVPSAAGHTYTMSAQLVGSPSTGPFAFDRALTAMEFKTST